MFTGIVEEIGEVVAVHRADDGASAVLTVRGATVVAGLPPGASLAVDGVCLTAVARDDDQTGQPADHVDLDVMAETLDRSTLGARQPGDAVNLERAVPVAGRLDGHVVQGHVDGTGTVLDRMPGDRWEVVRIGLPADLERYVVQKGSIAVDGTSLTVSGRGPGWFEVSLIPTTLGATVFGHRGTGAEVNLEVDVLAKYVESVLAGRLP